MNDHHSRKGKLYLVPAPLDFGCATQSPITDVLPELTLRTAASLQHWICENAKSARAYLKRVGEHTPLIAPIQQMQLQELPREAHKKGDHGGKSGAVFDAKALLAPALAGHDMGLVSEAGMPAVADPGSSIVRAAHDAGIPVIPLVGPVSLLMTLAASGLNGQNFAFVGYLPQDASQRTQRIKELEQLVQRHNQAQLFIETPYRNPALWQALLTSLQANTRLVMASGLTLESASIQSRCVKDWKKLGTAPDNRTPVVFAIGQ
ncbi:SAM-dependent methyltransferase [Comamonas kerstersii]|uniref:SAM-dependent methyltransferase n=1 Tax=Comamonas kerstersii TaxID=225992 RepID=UPI00266C0590|nr:SAM-dependent methyltransferase [Comamonas kerstersii]